MLFIDPPVKGERTSADLGVFVGAKRSRFFEGVNLSSLSLPMVWDLGKVSFTRGSFWAHDDAEPKHKPKLWDSIFGMRTKVTFIFLQFNRYCSCEMDKIFQFISKLQGRCAFHRFQYFS